VEYCICDNCSSVQVDNPFWVIEAHSKAISVLDTGLASRCISASRMLGTLLYLEGKKNAEGLDWGGGTGLLARLLRDQGFPVKSFDKYAVSLHAEGFEADLKDLSYPATFMSAIECFEHLLDPIESFKEIASNKEYFIFTTELINSPPQNPAIDPWWYFSPETGQHITFASHNGLGLFSKLIGFQVVTSFGSIHVLSRNKLRFRSRLILKNRIFRVFAILIVPELLHRFYSLTLADKHELISRSIKD
jgi:hypothetical protein